MARWTDNLRRVKLVDGRELIGASFRGVPFFVESTERQGGRRTVTHEFPGRDDPFIEELGRKSRTFRVEGYVLGIDYIAQRDALLAALEDTAGPGQLVHPSHGVRNVICSGLTSHETLTADGGISRIGIEFTEAPVQSIEPTVDANLAGVVSANADAAGLASDTEFQSVFKPAGLPSFALASSVQAITNMANGLRNALAPIVKGTQELAQLEGQIVVITSEAQTLVKTPAQVFGAFENVIEGIADTIAAIPDQVVKALVQAYDVDLGTEAPTTTPTREQERANQDAMKRVLQQVVIIEASHIITSATYTSIEDATAARDAVADRLEEQASVAGDTAYPALMELRSSLVRAVPSDTVRARIVTVTRRVDIPSILLSYQLYGSTDEEQDIIDRNDIRHPGFVAGDLRVLSNA